MANGHKRDFCVTVMAVLFTVLALSNFTKAFQFRSDPTHLGIVLFGVRAATFSSNLMLGAVMGLVLLAYAYGLWTLQSWVFPLSVVYAFWVPVNLVLFWHRDVGPVIPPVGAILGYLAVALGGSIGTALYLAYRRDALLGRR
jgi:hypothetical protein